VAIQAIYDVPEQAGCIGAFTMKLKKKATVARRVRRSHNPEFKANLRSILFPLQAKIGQLTLENHFLERALTKAGLLNAKR
jgi:hypothetical protein